MSSEYCCYCLVSTVNKNVTYFGCTNNISRRLRQHNGEICGGARATRSNRPWKLWFCINGFGNNSSSALRYEWFCKVKHNKHLRVQKNKTNPIYSLSQERRIQMALNAINKIDSSAVSLHGLSLSTSDEELQHRFSNVFVK